MKADQAKTTIICAGLSCLDLQLIGCTKSGQAEAIEQYEKAVHCAGGSASMAATTLALLCDDDIHVLTKLGKDLNGQVMLDFYRQAGAKTDLCIQDEMVSTAMAVLPIFKEGGRACFFNLAANNGFTTEELLGQLNKLSAAKAFLFGYPHLLPKMQGEPLKSMLESIRTKFGHDILIGVDLNGVSADNHRPELLAPAMDQIDVLHLNEEEAEILAGVQKDDLFSGDETLQQVTAALHQQGCAVVLLSLGSKGSYISVTPDSSRLSQCPPIVRDNWKAQSAVRVPAFAVAENNVNANGAGDALFSGFCYAAATMEGATLEQAGTFASLVARQRCDVQTRDKPEHDATKIAELVRTGNLPSVL
ncbi:pfkB family carbohydrate kinase [Seminavis robusta]|uniref:PfkB family carbohydrate kinase n=1 Tax=Seminavis robusta TaxID=568900 RepID=A0A9N8D965_9STRA|nr:pfkB family carbohydrate kinase [Seminavis robusta]|eukprot:Sro20_g014440.1 pfkB family carbohydrate kinase (361) ;mRNA; r:168992-170074